MKATTILFFAVLTASAQFGPRAVIRTIGQYDSDGSALYSVYIASGPEDVGNLNIAVALPPGARFIESVHKPATAEFEGVQKDAVFWAVPKLEKDSLLGPFVFRARSDGSGTEFPATLFGVLAYQQPVLETVTSPPSEGRLTGYADKGSLTIDERGTVDSAGNPAPVAVGDTGVVFLIPEGALDQNVTITVSRVPIQSLQLPATDPPTWWCSTFDIRMDPQIPFAKPVKFAVPTRRAVPPGLTASTFAAGAAPAKDPARTIAFGFGGFGGTTCTTYPFNFVQCSAPAGFGFGGFGAFGYVEQDNLVSKRTGAQLSTLGANSAAALLATPPSLSAALRTLP
jgi:hypothetical protein